MKYEVKKFDIIRGEWVYLNTYKTYHDAQAAITEMRRRYGGEYRIF